MNHSLKPWNTFGIERFAKAIVRAETEKQLLDAWQGAVAERQPTLILGEGSNVFCSNRLVIVAVLRQVQSLVSAASS